MVALKAVPEDESSGPLVVEPAVKGKYRWLGTSTLTFVPTDTLPFSTVFRARVPAGEGTRRQYVEPGLRMDIRDATAATREEPPIKRRLLYCPSQEHFTLVQPAGRSLRLGTIHFLYRQDSVNKTFLQFDLRQTQWGEEEWFNPKDTG